MTVTLIDFVLLQNVLFCGFLTVSDLSIFGCACNKILNLFWNKIMENENQAGVKYTEPLEFSFYSYKTRSKAETIDEWFNKHRAYKMEHVCIDQFEDVSCVLGVDILRHQKLTNLRVSNSFTLIPNEVASLAAFISSCSTTLLELRLFSVGITSAQLCSLSGLVCLKILCIVYCSAEFEGLFGVLNQCASLEMYQYQTSKKLDYCKGPSDRFVRTFDGTTVLEPRSPNKVPVLAPCFSHLKDVIMSNENLSIVRLSYDCQVKCDIKRIRKELSNVKRSVSFKVSHKYLCNFDRVLSDRVDDSDVSDDDGEL